MVDKKLLELKLKQKKKKPQFCRKDNNKKPRIEDNVWRRARGTDNKTRLKMKGHRKWPMSGFRSPVAVRGLDRTGLLPVVVSNKKELATISKHQGIIIASSVGDRNRQLILQEAKAKQIVVLNLDATKAIEQIDAKLKQRQADRQKHVESQKKEEEKQKKKEEKKHAAPKAEVKSAEEPELSDEDKQKKEKEEKDKVLTHK